MKDAGGAVPPSFPVVPFSVSYNPQPKIDFGLDPADFQPLPETALGPVASLVSADKSSVVSGEAVTIWAGLDFLGSSLDGAVSSAMLPVTIFQSTEPFRGFFGDCPVYSHLARIF
jgi:hypothetical protein